MAEKKLKFTAEEIDILLQKVKDGDIPIEEINGKLTLIGGQLYVGKTEDGFAKLFIGVDQTEDDIEQAKTLGIPAIMKDEYGDLYIVAKPNINLIAGNDWIYAGDGGAGLYAERDGGSSGVEANGDTLSLYADGADGYNPAIEIGPADTKVHNLADPSEGGDAVPKRYVDNLALGGGGGGPVDWEDIQNKPFGEMIMTLVDNQTITLYDGQGIIEPSVELLAGKEYTVIYNGTEYTVIATEITMDDSSSILAGNLAPIGMEDTGEPFCIGYTGGMSMIVVLDGSSEVVLTIIGPGTKPIDKKYLPPVSTVKYLYWQITDSICYLYKDSAYMEKVTKAYLEDLVEENAIIMVKNGANLNLVATIWFNDTTEYGVVYICTTYGGIDGDVGGEFVEMRLRKAYTAEYTG